MCTCLQSPLLLKLDKFQLWEQSLSIQIFHRCRICQANYGDLICGLCSCMERFLFLLLSHTTPGAQLWFWPQLCVCHPQASVPHPGEREWTQQLIGAHLLRPGRGTAATTRVCVKCLWWWRPAGSCNRLEHACFGGSPSHCLQRQWLACGGSGSPAPCVPLNNGTSFPRQTTFPLGAFPAMEPLTPVPFVVSTQATAILSLDSLS